MPDYLVGHNVNIESHESKNHDGDMAMASEGAENSVHRVWRGMKKVIENGMTGHVSMGKESGVGQHRSDDYHAE